MVDCEDTGWIELAEGSCSVMSVFIISAELSDSATTLLV